MAMIKNKICDVVSYNGEEDIFDIRYNILKDYVDQFIVVEARHTFSGLEKPLYFEKIISKYDKIKYHVIDENYSDEEIAQAYSSPNTQGADHWKREFLQKEAIKKALLDLDDEDIVYIGDCDEIWDPLIPREEFTKVYKLKQLVYAYYLNNRSDEPWAGTFVAKYKNIKNECLNHLRASLQVQLNKPETWHMDTHLENGGWHFTSCGGFDQFKRKLESCYTSEDYWDGDVQANLKSNYDSGKDWLDGWRGWQRKFNFFIDESEWPQYLKDNKNKYKHLCK